MERGEGKKDMERHLASKVITSFNACKEGDPQAKYRHLGEETPRASTTKQDDVSWPEDRQLTCRGPTTADSRKPNRPGVENHQNATKVEEMDGLTSWKPPLE